ncbi:MAG: peptidoglycan DD-metalloendopeptidase family protein [Winogradskyella sp.]|nr:peptidoglycan DD-metalloendopeptidase family protein [Winogradskyella sp.]
MKQDLSVIFLLLVTLSVSAQRHDNIQKAFVEHYNVSNTEGIFNMFNTEMQNFLPLSKTVDFIEAMITQAGEILHTEFIKQNGNVAQYKVSFQKAVFTMQLSLDQDNKINGLRFIPFTDTSKPMLKRNITKLILPFKGEWTVIWGGDTKDLNYHVDVESQKGAFDMVITNKEGNSFRTDGKTNEDYYAFGKELIAPCNAEVVMVVDGIKDNVPGEMNPIYIPGNTVVLKTDNNEYLFFAHLKQHSIVVRQGQKLKQGDLLGLCGNSGNSSEPHLHFHIQNVEEMYKATGVKCYFDSIMVNDQLEKEYSPIQNDKVKNQSKL